MEQTIERFSNETDQIESYTLVSRLEKVKVKQAHFAVNHLYYQRQSDGELFEPFEDPDFNLKRDYDLYRTEHHLLSADAIKAIRTTYHLNLRDFAKLIGISYANLSSIENGSIQANYIDNLLRLVADPYAFLQLLSAKPNAITQKVQDNLELHLKKLIISSRLKNDRQAPLRQKE